MRAAAFAAASLLVIVAACVYSRRGAAPEIQWTPDNSNRITRSGTLVLHAPAGDLTSIPTKLQWSEVPGAASYEVRILEVDQTVLWRGSTTASELTLPQEIRQRLVPGKTMLWNVTGRDAAGQNIAVSETGKFRLTLQPRP